MKTKSTMRLFVTFLVIISVVTGVAFFVTMSMSADQAPDGAVDWDLVLPVTGYTFLTAWGLIGIAVVFSKFKKKRSQALEEVMESVANELGLEFQWGSESDGPSIAGTLGEVPVNVAVKRPKNNSRSYSELGGPSTAAYTIFTVTIPNRICDTSLCTQPVTPDAESTLSEGELMAIRKKLNHISLPHQLRKVRITQTLIICSLKDSLSPIIRSRDDIVYAVKALQKMARVLTGPTT